MSYAANSIILDIRDRSEHEDPEIDSTSIQIPTNPNEAVHKQNPDIPQIRSRRERQIKPRQIWSPS